MNTIKITLENEKHKFCSTNLTKSWNWGGRKGMQKGITFNSVSKNKIIVKKR